MDDSRNGNKALEIDLYDEGSRFGVELHGIYYHKEFDGKAGVDKFYHRTKAELAEKEQIKLLQFFEDELTYREDIVKSMILAKLGKNESVFARKCEVKEVTYEHSSAFLEQNHLQGSCKSFLKLGLYFKDSLVSLITFRRTDNDKEVEIARFANKLGMSVPGGFAKLLSAATTILKEMGFTTITTYADRRYSNGSVYKNNGFVFHHFTDPDMFWVKKDQRYARQISWGKSDEEMFTEGYYKIYGAGHSYWTKQIK